MTIFFFFSFHSLWTITTYLKFLIQDNGTNLMQRRKIPTSAGFRTFWNNPWEFYTLLRFVCRRNRQLLRDFIHWTPDGHADFLYFPWNVNYYPNWNPSWSTFSWKLFLFFTYFASVYMFRSFFSPQVFVARICPSIVYSLEAIFLLRPVITYPSLVCA